MERTQKIYTTGADPEDAKRAMIMLHGRGSDINDMKSVIPSLRLKSDTYIILPEAPLEIMPGRYAWYSHFWNEQLEDNLSQLENSFSVINACIQNLEENNLKVEDTILLGHSQGGNLLLEYIAAYPNAFKAVIILRGCFLGEHARDRHFKKKVDRRTRFILHAGRRDPYIPAKKFDQTVAILEKLGASRIHRKQFDAGHGICRQELNDIKKMLKENFVNV